MKKLMLWLLFAGTFSFVADRAFANEYNITVTGEIHNYDGAAAVDIPVALCIGYKPLHCPEQSQAVTDKKGNFLFVRKGTLSIPENLSAEEKELVFVSQEIIFYVQKNDKWLKLWSVNSFVNASMPKTLSFDCTLGAHPYCDDAPLWNGHAMHFAPE